eukprot:scaffold324244_cov578-Tisochrysis_lutea.AAC.3
MDQTNPLAELTHKRRLSVLGPGGIARDRAGFVVRDIHPSQYGRICPVETPEGPNAVKQGKVLRNSPPLYLDAITEDQFKLAAGDVATDSEGFIKDPIIPVRHRQEIITVPRAEVEYMAISPIQVVSLATSLIPFLEHDDANRALMGSNMQRQSVPLLYADAPLVGTGLESQTARDSGMEIK